MKKERRSDGATKRRSGRFAMLLGCLMLAAGCGRGTDDAAVVATTEVRFEVDGMTCNNCVQFIQDRMGRVEGVAGCVVSLDDASAAAQVTDGSVADAIIASLAETPYEVRRAGSSVDLVFALAGVECSRCAEFVEQRLAGVEGVRRAVVDVDRRRLAVRAADNAVRERITAALAETAYDAVLPEP